MFVVEREWATLHYMDDVAFRDVAYEAELLPIFKSGIKKGYTAVDVGAHQGTYTTLFASLVGSGTVMSFEPHPDNMWYLQKNIDENRHRWSDATITVNEVALGDEVGMKNLRCWRNATGRHQLIEGENPDYSIPVSITKLDNIPMREVDFIKIDVEHHEAHVLNGARITIREFKPDILVEVHSAENSVMVAQFGQDMGYQVELLNARIPSVQHTGHYMLLTQ